MAKYLFAYHGGGGNDSVTEAEMGEIMAAWGAWMGRHSAALVDGGNPCGEAKTVASDGSVSDGGGTNPVTGYGIFNADSLDAAVEIAKGCPVLNSGGNVEVTEAIDIGM